jgi:hypothetical protein
MLSSPSYRTITIAMSICIASSPSTEPENVDPGTQLASPTKRAFSSQRDSEDRPEDGEAKRRHIQRHRDPLLCTGACASCDHREYMSGSSSYSWDSACPLSPSDNWLRPPSRRGADASWSCDVQSSPASEVPRSIWNEKCTFDSVIAGWPPEPQRTPKSAEEIAQTSYDNLEVCATISGPSTSTEFPPSHPSTPAMSPDEGEAHTSFTFPSPLTLPFHNASSSIDETQHTTSNSPATSLAPIGSGRQSLRPLHPEPMASNIDNELALSSLRSTVLQEKEAWVDVDDDDSSNLLQQVSIIRLAVGGMQIYRPVYDPDGEKHAESRVPLDRHLYNTIHNEYSPLTVSPLNPLRNPPPDLHWRTMPVVLQRTDPKHFLQG